jgi:hypothetical protein
MKTIEIKLYSFEELSKEAQEKALNKWNENGDSVYMDFFYENCVEEAKEHGFVNPVINYSLSYSQGDGLSFKADGYNNLEALFIETLGQGKEKTAKLLADNCRLICQGNTGRYAYSSSSDIDLYFDANTNTNNKNINSAVNEALKSLTDIYLALCKKLEKQGYDEIEYQQSEESFKETCQANDYTFEVNGNMRNF